MSDLVAEEFSRLRWHSLSYDQELLNLLVAGLPNPQIARTLGLTPGGLRGRLYRLMQRFDVGSRGELVYLALLLDLVPIAPASIPARLAELRERPRKGDECKKV